MMTSRQRLVAALSHHEPDRVPLDLAGTLTSGINIGAYQRLCAAAGVPGPHVLLQRSQMLARVDPRITELLGIDTGCVIPNPPQDWADIERGDGKFEDEWGVVYQPAAQGDTYFPCAHPLKEASIDDLKTYKWPDPNDPARTRGLAERAEHLHSTTSVGLIGELSAFVMQQAQNLRGYDTFLEDLYGNRRFAEALLDGILEFDIRLAENFLGKVGRYIEMVTIGDDLGIQTSLMISPDLYRRMVKPRHKQLVGAIKRLTDAKVFFHTCGAVFSLIPDLIEVGVEVLNPVQVAARGMNDTGLLKREFGKDLVFWGAIDTQHVLPFCTPEQVAAEVRRRVDDLGPGGGYVLAPVHNIQAETPDANILAMYLSARPDGRLRL